MDAAIKERYKALSKAHRQNDRAIWEACGGAWDIGSESGCVARLMRCYQILTAADGKK